MGKKKYFLTVDTETTQTDKVADIGLVVSDKQGRIIKQIGILTEFFANREQHPLFHMGDFLGGARNLPKRYDAYNDMVKQGDRFIATCAAVNKWLVRARLEYNPILTAYNLAFDRSKCANSGIDLTIFNKSFCLWHAAAHKWAGTRAYKQFVLDNHFFGNRTKLGHMGFQTKADGMAKFLLGADLEDEPHTALEDARDYEVPILTKLVNSTSPKVYMDPPPYSWRDYALRDHFKPK